MTPRHDLPADPLAERAVLGATLSAPDVIDQYRITDDLFADARVRQAFGVLRDRYAAGTPAADVVQATEALRAAGIAQPATLLGEAWEAAGQAPVAVVVPQLRAYARRRELWRIGDTLRRLSADSADVRGLLEGQLDRLTAVLADQPLPGTVVSLREAVLERLRCYETGDRAHGVTTGFPDLDLMLGGLPVGELVIVAGRPSIGKSALVHQIAVHVARQQRHVLLVTPEMAVAQVVDRVLCQHGPLESDALRAQPLSDVTWRRLHQTVPELPELSLYDAACDVAAIRALARQVHARQRIDLLIVDHLGWVVERARPGENYTVAVGRATKGLKAIGRSLSCAVVVVCQLNRASEVGTEMRRPGLAELRDSGEIEQDADSVLLVHRVSREAQDAEVIVAKQRNGPTGIVRLVWQAQTTRFVSAEYGYENGRPHVR